MNKVSLLALALVIALPGCCCRKESKQPVKKNNIAKYMNVTEVPEVVEEENDSEEDLDLSDLDDLADLDSDEYGFGDDTDLDDEDEVEEDEDNIETGFRWVDSQDDEFKPLYFTFNHYGIRPDQQSSLSYDIDQVKQLLSDSGTTAEPTIVIEGHACQEGTPAYNVALSEKRAKYVADLFVAAGVDRSVIKVVGRGQECPAMINGKIANGSREDRAPNRRVEVRVIYT